jgi:hypothetical protein
MPSLEFIAKTVREFVELTLEGREKQLHSTFRSTSDAVTPPAHPLSQVPK